MFSGIVLFAFLLLIVLLAIAADMALGWIRWHMTSQIGPPMGLLSQAQRGRRWGWMLRVSRRQMLVQLRSIVSQIGTVTRLNLPLAPALVAASREEHGRTGGALNSIGRWVAAGAPLSEAIERSVPACPSFAVSIVAAGERAGQVPRALEVLEEMLDDRIRRFQSLTSGYWVYPTALAFALWLIVTMVMVIVVPKMKEIFADFDAEMPRSTELLIQVSRWFVQGSPPGWAVLMLPLLVVLALFVLSALPRRSESLSRLSVIGDTFRWWLPVVHDIERGTGTAAAVEVMNFGLTAGMGLDSSAELASTIDVNHHVRQRFDDFAVFLRRGTPAGEAAGHARLGPVLVAAVNSIVRGSPAQGALAHAAQYHRAMARRWWHLLAQFCWPMVTVVCAVGVAFVMLALFTPMIALMEAAMDY